MWAKAISPLASGALLKKDKLPTLTADERAVAFAYFKEDIDRLESLLSVNLDHWKI